MQPANRTTMQTQNVNPAKSTSGCGCGKVGQQSKSKNSKVEHILPVKKCPKTIGWEHAKFYVTVLTDQNFNQW